MKRIAALTLFVAAGLAGGSAIAQTSPKAKAKQPGSSATTKANSAPKPKPTSANDEAKPGTKVVALSRPTATPDGIDQPDAATRILGAYDKGQRLESVSRRLALGAYREAAQQGHGPSQKRMWELLKDTPGSESVATVYQSAAWNQKVPGVPEPKSPIRFN